MNNKIKEYVRESGLEIFGLGARRLQSGAKHDMWTAAIDRFADMIVDSICDDMLSLEPMYPANIVALKIRQKYLSSVNKELGSLDPNGSLDQYDDPIWHGKQTFKGK